MKIRMADTTRDQRYGALLADHVYEVDDDFGAHLKDAGIAKASTAQDVDTPGEPTLQGNTEPSYTAAVTREDVEGLTGPQPAPRVPRK